ncbi:stomatin [Plantactinospora sp. S1510]|uniref:Stomatin n=1 Tax=Plantactinospora alkalitolerans TaxID=2789879 RepID=A0ABS0HA43_9ACTN|nr:SPFH domain-containing protein [Plantactinospora alkalitolerans]MBF9135347.1 stomatin [Plantactinospora alkalitolerans]
MPALFVAALVLFALAVVAALAAAVSRDHRAGAAGGAVVAAFLGMLFTVSASANTVPTRNVGIVTAFNKPTGEVTGAGLKWVAPWKKVEDWDASRQTFDHKSQKTCVQVRIVGLQGACVEVQIEYQTHSAKAPEQWASYKRDFGLFMNRRVEPNLTGALNDIFAAHDPLSNVDATTGVVKPVDTAALVEPLKANIANRTGEDIQILGVVFGFVHYAEKTQQQIEAFQQKVLEAKNLEQDRKNAELQRQVSAKNAQVNPTVRCLEIAAQHGKEPGFCLGGGNPVQTQK